MWLTLCVALVFSSRVHAQIYGSWTYEAPPDHLADVTWLENARLGTLQLSGCAAALVSADGLAVTSASCLRASVARIVGDSAATAGMYAQSLAGEIALAPLVARQIVDMTDITGQDEADHMADYTLEYHLLARDDSTRFWLYAFRPFRDVRLVLLPSAMAAGFGQDRAVFPRHRVDFAFIRLYAPDGTPYITENYYAWSEARPSAGETIYATSIPQYTPMLSASSVEVYPYNGTITPPFTTLYGMLDLHFAHGASGDWALPTNWLARQDALELGAPLNFAVAGRCTQLGTAFVSQDLEVRGVAFEQTGIGGESRCISVAAAGVLTVLRGIYSADRIAEELELQQIEN